MPEAAIVERRPQPDRARVPGHWLSCARTRPPPTWSIGCSSATRRSAGDDRGRLLRLRNAPGPAGVQHRADHRAVRAAPADGHRGDVLALLRLEPDAIRHAANAVKAGEGDAYVAAGSSGSAATTSGIEPPSRRPEPEAAGRRRPAERLHRDGADRGQRREEVRGQPRGHGQVRAALAGARRPHRRPGSSTARSCRSPTRTATRSPRTTARDRARRWRSCPAARLSAAAASPPATPARSTTARRRCW